MQLIGQESNLELIKNWGTLPQFIIIQGDKHTGKTYFISYLCNIFKLHYVRMNNGINDVRSLLDAMVPDSNTIYHFKDFDSASLQAKNALLKITEEPIRGNYIIITGSSQLKTLESRARKIIMAPYKESDVKQYMKKYYIPTVIDKLYIAGCNTPAKVNMYKNYEHIDALLNYVFYIYEHITYISLDEIISMLSRFESRYDKEGIDSCLLFLTLLINVIEYNIKKDNYYSYYKILSILIQSKNMLRKEYTLNRKFLLFRTFYDIYLLRNVK